VLDLEGELQALRRQVEELQERITAMEREAERQVAEIHRSYRKEIVLRSSLHPQRK
jgi:hypothetical protein